MTLSLMAEVVAEGKTAAVVGDEDRAGWNLALYKLEGFLHQLLTLVAGLDIGASWVREHIAHDKDQRESQDKRSSPPAAIRPTGEADRDSGHREAAQHCVMARAAVRIETGNRHGAIDDERKYKDHPKLTRARHPPSRRPPTF